jgi:hypothetical protein
MQRTLSDNTYNRQISMSLAGYEPVIPASKRPQTHTLDGAATGIGYKYDLLTISTYIYYCIITGKAKVSVFSGSVLGTSSRELEEANILTPSSE